MPEGPEIRHSRDDIARVLVGQTILHVDAIHRALKNDAHALEQSIVTAVESRGKAMLIHFDVGLTVYSHNQLYGVWQTGLPRHYLTTNRQLRFGLHTVKGSALLYSASDISVWPTDQIHTHPFLRKLGPDVLNQRPTPGLIIERLNNKAFSGRKLASLYLDQRFLAGIGNYLRSEILFFAGVNPDLRASELTGNEKQKLAAETIAVTFRAYQNNGYTVPQPVYKYAIQHNLPYEASRFMVFNRDGQPCRVCQTPIIRTERGSRRIYLCKHCQSR